MQDTEQCRIVREVDKHENISHLSLLYEDTGSLRSRLLYDNCCGGGSCSCGHEGYGDDDCS